MDEIERIKLLIDSEGLTREKFARLIDMPYSRLLNVFSGRAKPRFEDMAAIEREWPEYGYWIAYGKELPEAGQISPMTKAAMDNLKTQGKAD